MGDDTRLDDERRPSSVVTMLIGCLLVALILALAFAAWHFLSARHTILPPPGDVLAMFRDLVGQGDVLRATMATGRTWAIAFAIAAVLGVALGLLAGRARAAGLVAPGLFVFSALPVPAAAVVLVAWLGPGSSTAAIATGALLALIPIAAMMARSRPIAGGGLRWKATFHALEIGVALALFGVLAAEIVGSRGRLGRTIFEALTNFDTKRIFALFFLAWFLALAAMLPFAIARAFCGRSR